MIKEGPSILLKLLRNEIEVSWRFFILYMAAYSQNRQLHDLKEIMTEIDMIEFIIIYKDFQVPLS
jgi:hypothetical protein